MRVGGDDEYLQLEAGTTIRERDNFKYLGVIF